MAQYDIWPKMATAVDTYVQSCDSCARNKVVRHAPYGLLSPLPIHTRPWSSVSLDWITDLPPSHYHDAILVVVDRLTKHAVFIPTTKSMAAPDVAALFLQHVVRVHGLPKTLVSDRDPVFTSQFWRRWRSVASGPTALLPSTPGRMVRRRG